MSVFTNAAAAAEESQAYVTAVLDLLGDRAPLEVLRATPGELRDLVSSHTPDELRRPERPGKWSTAEVVGHLADSDLVWAHRMRRVAAEDRPTLVGFDQDLWAENLRYRDLEPETVLDEFETVRGLNLRFIARLDPTALERVGIHSARGEESLDLMIRLYAGHDLVHLAQVERILTTAR